MTSRLVARHGARGPRGKGEYRAIAVCSRWTLRDLSGAVCPSGVERKKLFFLIWPCNRLPFSIQQSPVFDSVSFYFRRKTEIVLLTRFDLIEKLFQTEIWYHSIQWRAHFPGYMDTVHTAPEIALLKRLPRGDGFIWVESRILNGIDFNLQLFILIAAA